MKIILSVLSGLIVSSSNVNLHLVKTWNVGSNTVNRIYDSDAGVLCYVISNPLDSTVTGISCVPLKLDVSL